MMYNVVLYSAVQEVNQLHIYIYIHSFIDSLPIHVTTEY